MHEETLEMFTTPPSIPMTYLPPPGRRLGKIRRGASSRSILCGDGRFSPEDFHADHF